MDKEILNKSYAIQRKIEELKHSIKLLEARDLDKDIRFKNPKICLEFDDTNLHGTRVWHDLGIKLNEGIISTFLTLIEVESNRLLIEFKELETKQ